MRRRRLRFSRPVPRATSIDNTRTSSRARHLGLFGAGADASVQPSAAPVPSPPAYPILDKPAQTPRVSHDSASDLSAFGASRARCVLDLVAGQVVPRLFGGSCPACAPHHGGVVDRGGAPRGALYTAHIRFDESRCAFFLSVPILLPDVRCTQDCCGRIVHIVKHRFTFTASVCDYFLVATRVFTLTIADSSII